MTTAQNSLIDSLGRVKQFSKRMNRGGSFFFRGKKSQGSSTTTKNTNNKKPVTQNNPKTNGVESPPIDHLQSRLNRFNCLLDTDNIDLGTYLLSTNFSQTY